MGWIMIRPRVIYILLLFHTGSTTILLISAWTAMALHEVVSVCEKRENKDPFV